MWFCGYCCTAFPGVKKVLIHLGSLEHRTLALKKVDELAEKKVKNEETEDSVCERDLQ